MNIYLIISCVFASSFLIAFALLYLYSRAKDPIKQRLGDLQNPSVIIKEKGEASIKRNLSFFGVDGEQPSATRLWLAKAGYRKAQSVSNYYGGRLLSTAIMSAIGSMLGLSLHLNSTELVASIMVGTLVGWYVPTIWIMRKILNRREQIRRAVPNMLDIMVVCVEAGLSFTGAIHRIVDENKDNTNPLFEELRLMTQEFLLGSSKADAFRNLADRTGVEDIRSLAITLIQAEKLGTSIADSLRVLADSMRFKRRQRAEEMANKTSVKLVFPLVLLIFPELMVILVGPALITLFKTFSDIVK